MILSRFVSNSSSPSHPLCVNVEKLGADQEVVFVGNVNAQTSPSGKPLYAPRASRHGSKKSALDDLAVEEVMRGKRQTLGEGHFDDAGVWVPALKSSLSEESLKELNRGEGSFGKSLLKAQGLFARKRREASEQDKSVPVVSKSGRFGNDKPADVKGTFLVYQSTSILLKKKQMFRAQPFISENLC